MGQEGGPGEVFCDVRFYVGEVLSEMGLAVLGKIMSSIVLSGHVPAPDGP